MSEAAATLRQLVKSVAYMAIPQIRREARASVRPVNLSTFKHMTKGTQNHDGFVRNANYRALDWWLIVSDTSGHLSSPHRVDHSMTGRRNAPL